jgi:hypothetical protein
MPNPVPIADLLSQIRRLNAPLMGAAGHPVAHAPPAGGEPLDLTVPLVRTASMLVGLAVPMSGAVPLTGAAPPARAGVPAAAPAVRSGTGVPKMELLRELVPLNARVLDLVQAEPVA